MTIVPEHPCCPHQEAYEVRFGQLEADMAKVKDQAAATALGFADLKGYIRGAVWSGMAACALISFASAVLLHFVGK